MLLPRYFRSPLAHLFRSLPIKGRWRIAAHLHRLFSAGPDTFDLPEVGRLTLPLDLEMQQQLYWAGLSRDDVGILRLARAVLPPDGVFLDIGANIGIHTLAAARHLANGGGAVLAFEPHPVNHRILVRNIEQNRLRHATAENLGLADAPAILTGAAATEGGNWSLASRGEHRFEVQLVRLDDYLRDHPLPRLDLMKIDVEGAEVRVLQGARRTIERFRPTIVFEVCPAWLAKLGTSPAELFTELLGHGYSIHALPGRNLVWGPRIKLGDLAGLDDAAFVNLVAVPSSVQRDSGSEVETEAAARS